MPRALGYCWPCHELGRHFVEATVMIDGDPHCAACARLGQTMQPKEAAAETTQAAIVAAQEQRQPRPRSVCARCGRPAHRGGCISATVPATPDPIPLGAKESAARSMDSLICEVIDEKDVPDVDQTPRASGRLGKLWLRLLELPEGKWLKVQNRDRNHAVNTARHITYKAKKISRELKHKVVGTDLFCRLEAR